MTKLRLKEIINSTGRRKIREKDVSLSVMADPPTVRLGSVQMPKEVTEGDPKWLKAKLVLEASQGQNASFDRVEVGRVEDVVSRSPMLIHQLKNFADASDASFALKIVGDDGLILASADDIRPDDQRPGETESLLKVKAKPLGEVPWIVEFSPAGQTFIAVNSKIPGAESWIESNSVASAMVLPAALRAVLMRLVSDEEFQATEWGKAWRQWVGRHATSPMPDVDDDDEGLTPEEWVEEVVVVFSQSNSITSKLVQQLEAPAVGAHE